MGEYPEVFEEYEQSTFQPGRFGQFGEKRFLERGELMKERLNILKSSQKIIKESKEEMKAQFELISPE